MNRLATLAIALAALATGACTTSGMNRLQPVDATRYHLGTPIPQGTVTIEPLSSTQEISVDYRRYADAVAAQLQSLGYTPVPDGSESDYVAGIAFRRADAGVLRERSPVTIGLGGGTSSGNVGLGGGASIGLGGKDRHIIISELSVHLRRRGDGTTVWEGRAQTRSLDEVPETQPSPDRLAGALFKGFPGESGITITVE
ncbi:DUF4136 domain-containing protein [Stakelama tenebrarum]|uniref:DUF4136 domain-containing protein n=1 Tax=Stakelama tenebrarum TaxID=2711215 RepID=A0A6G6YA06_9SPHN|nr:DUF4136 domain-containing protein [Sphingosinithalassobacter tenebrarum]QIG81406.1 DUF4136 domain-containing protein [Sphingosinithalassobacter tenebrarum]